MPIKYQMLGGRGGTDLLLKVAPNVSVTLSKGAYTKTVTANNQGQALFKNLSNGTYTATAQGSDGERYQKEILIDDVQEESFVARKIADLPIGSKIRFSSGRKFILMKHKAKAHDQNSATLVSEFIQEDFSWGQNKYYDSYTKLQTLLEKYLNELDTYERKSVLKFTADGLRYDKAKTVEQHFYFLSLSELGILDGIFDGYGNGQDRNLGFDTKASRIKRHENGSAYRYYVRNVFSYNNVRTQYVVEASGDHNRLDVHSSSASSFTAGIVLGVDISENAMVYLESDGYYRVSDK